VTLYPIHIFFPELGSGILLAQARACDMRNGPQRLLATDLLRHCVLIYDGIAGRVTPFN
jgi:hypothetical protein